MSPPAVRFLSLFVDDPEATASRLVTLLGCARREPACAPTPHPFAAEGPIVLDLGTIELALYRASATKGTHAGDVGIGVAIDATDLEARLHASGARALAPATTLADGRAMRVAMTPERHFFELIAGARRS